MTTTSTYDDEFFRTFGDEPDESSRQVLRTAFAFLKPDSVVDIGCGTGKWIATALMLGAREGFGVDGAYVPREQRLIAPDRFIERDLQNSPLALGRKFDMAICLEVAEHLSRRRSESFVAELCGLSDLILFSAAPPFQEGTNHVNEQWLEYWGILFRHEQFVPVDVIRDASAYATALPKRVRQSCRVDPPQLTSSCISTLPSWFVIRLEIMLAETVVAR